MIRRSISTLMIFLTTQIRQSLLLIPINLLARRCLASFVVFNALLSAGSRRCDPWHLQHAVYLIHPLRFLLSHFELSLASHLLPRTSMLSPALQWLFTVLSLKRTKRPLLVLMRLVGEKLCKMKSMQ